MSKATGGMSTRRHSPVDAPPDPTLPLTRVLPVLTRRPVTVSVEGTGEGSRRVVADGPRDRPYGLVSVSKPGGGEIHAPAGQVSAGCGAERAGEASGQAGSGDSDSSRQRVRGPVAVRFAVYQAHRVAGDRVQPRVELGGRPVVGPPREHRSDELHEQEVDHAVHGSRHADLRLGELGVDELADGGEPGILMSTEVQGRGEHEQRRGAQVMRRSGSIWPAVIVHAVNNAALPLLVLLTGTSGPAV